jgi:hypothetical protein
MDDQSAKILCHWLESVIKAGEICALTVHQNKTTAETAAVPQYGIYRILNP